VKPRDRNRQEPKAMSAPLQTFRQAHSSQRYRKYLHHKHWRSTGLFRKEVTGKTTMYMVFLYRKHIA